MVLPTTIVYRCLKASGQLLQLQTANTIEALADVVDRRRLLIVTQLWMLVAAALLATFTLAGAMNPALLLSLTFVLGVGSA